MAYSKSVQVLRAVANLAITGIVVLPVLLFYLYGEPTQRGFFCRDESLRHPYLGSTVPAYGLYLFAFLVPLACILLVECLHADTTPGLLLNLYFTYLGYLFGAAVSQCLTDFSKYSVGRLRPHFIQVCKPDFSSIDCGSEQEPNFVTDYHCQGNSELFPDLEDRRYRVKESHVSFVSGHASCAFQAAVFVVIYLQTRGCAAIRRKRRMLVLPFVQFVVLAAALFIAISRVMDYKHHPGDVMAGALLGCIVQLLNTLFVMKLCSKTPAQLETPSTIPLQST